MGLRAKHGCLLETILSQKIRKEYVGVAWVVCVAFRPLDPACNLYELHIIHPCGRERRLRAHVQHGKQCMQPFRHVPEILVQTISFLH